MTGCVSNVSLTEHDMEGTLQRSDMNNKKVIENI